MGGVIVGLVSEFFGSSARIEADVARIEEQIMAEGADSASQHVTTGGVKHSHTVEHAFSIVKRGVIGTSHHLSDAHLGSYCHGFDLRYNTRES